MTQELENLIKEVNTMKFANNKNPLWTFHDLEYRYNKIYGTKECYTFLAGNIIETQGILRKMTGDNSIRMRLAKLEDGEITKFSAVNAKKYAIDEYHVIFLNVTRHFSTCEKASVHIENHIRGCAFTPKVVFDICQQLSPRDLEELLVMLNTHNPSAFTI